MTFEFRMETCKLLIEAQKHEPAAQVVQQLIQEDDENVELWYLLGYCYFHLQEYFDAKEVLTTANQVKNTIHYRCPSNGEAAAMYSSNYLLAEQCFVRWSHHADV